MIFFPNLKMKWFLVFNFSLAIFFNYYSSLSSNIVFTMNLFLFLGYEQQPGATLHLGQHHQDQAAYHQLAEPNLSPTSHLLEKPKYGLRLYWRWPLRGLRWTSRLPFGWEWRRVGGSRAFHARSL